jgi:hypothetical protein
MPSFTLLLMLAAAPAHPTATAPAAPAGACHALGPSQERVLGRRVERTMLIACPGGLAPTRLTVSFDTPAEGRPEAVGSTAARPEAAPAARDRRP